MQNLNVIKKFSIALFLWMVCFTVCYPQINEGNPSAWPKPTLKNMGDSGFYNTKEKLLTYYKWKENWRKENLPNLYFKDDQYEQIRKLFSPYYSFEEAGNQKGSFISLDSLHKLDMKDYSWIKHKLEPNKDGSPCLYLQDFFYDIYLVKIDSKNSGALLYKMDCWNSILDNDDATKYEIERQGDTLIKFKFPDDH